MSAQRWKPGTVAIIQIPKSTAPGHKVSAIGWAQVRAVATRDGGWVALDDPDYFWGPDYTFHANSPRPLVVIDPANRDDVVDLAAAFNATGPPELQAVFADRLQQALHAIANRTPPRPEEPTGRYAVVRAADGDDWIREDAPMRRPWRRVGDSYYLDYADINVVRVLFEGVSG